MTEEKIAIYTSQDGQIQLNISLKAETVWLTQAQLAELFEVKSQNITMHLKNIFSEGELEEKSTCKESLQVQMEGIRQVK